MTTFPPTGTDPCRPRARRAGLAVMALAASLAACSNSGGSGASQVVASVGGDEVTESQVNGLLERQTNLKPDQLDAASRRALESLVQQEIVLRKAREIKLDRDPKVVRDIETLKREVVAKAYLDRISEGATRPSEKDVQAYFDANPVLFNERNVFTFQELTVEASESQKKEIETQLTGLKTPDELESYLKSRQISAKASRSTVAAENLPMPLLQRVQALKPGQGLIVSAAGGLRILLLLSAQSSPVTIEQARPAISAFLLNQRKHIAVEQELTALRSGSKIEFFGKYADLGASAPSPGQPASAAAVSGNSIEAPATAVASSHRP